MKRKCIALSDSNYQYVDNLMQQKKVKNFSRAINEMIDKNREEKRDDSQHDNNSH